MHREGQEGVGGCVVVVAYLDLTEDEYVAAGEPGDQIVALEPGLSRSIFGWILDGQRTGQVQEITDEAARGLHFFLNASLDRQAFMAPLMEALATDTYLGLGGPQDPLHGYMERVAAIEDEDEAEKRREAKKREPR